MGVSDSNQAFTQCLHKAVSAAQGDQPHCGFPEAKYLDCVERLVRHGLRVVVVEQTETPEMLKARNDSRAHGTKKVCHLLSSTMILLPAHMTPSITAPRATIALLLVREACARSVGGYRITSTGLASFPRSYMHKQLLLLSSRGPGNHFTKAC